MKNHYNSHYIMDRLKDIAKHEGMDFILVVNKFADLRQKDATAVNLHNRIDALYEELKIEEVNDAWDEYCKACDRIILKLEIELDGER